MIRKHGLNEEQADAVRAATSGAQITILEGAPGAGKTTALAAITESWTHGDVDYRVIGASTAWKISHALRDELAIDARATDSWRVGVEHGVPFLARYCGSLRLAGGQRAEYRPCGRHRQADDHEPTGQRRQNRSGEQKGR
ncbi:AAA family ATPase [Bradyrhizobium sp. LB13.1]